MLSPSSRPLPQWGEGKGEGASPQKIKFICIRCFLDILPELKEIDKIIQAEIT
jgi:hypothetical protein